MEYKDRLKAARRHAKLTQGDLAKKVGITQTSISDLERGKSVSSSYNASIAKWCGVSAVWLEDGSGQMVVRDLRDVIKNTDLGGFDAPAEDPNAIRQKADEQERLLGAIADLHAIQSKIITGKLTDDLVELVKELRAAIAGKRKKVEPGPVAEASNVVMIKPKEPDASGDFNPDEHDLIRQSTARIAAGHGEQNTHVDIDRELAFKKTWIKRKRLTPSNLIVAYAWGSSMHPTIEDGDAVLIDTSSKILKNGCIYAFKDGEHEDIIKRAVKEKGAWLLRSDNPDKSVPEYQDMPFVDESGQQRFEVVGLAHWRGGDL